MNTNFKVIGLTRLGIKPESTAQETDAPYHSAISELSLVFSIPATWYGTLSIFSPLSVVCFCMF